MEGRHPVVRWAERSFGLLAEPCAREPDVVFRFVRERPAIGEVPWFGDADSHVAQSRQFLKVKHYHILVDRGGTGTRVLVHDREGRMGLGYYLRHLDLAFKTWFHHGRGLSTHLLKSFAYGIAPSILQTALLERDAALVHASCVERDGACLLMASPGGVGKTALCLEAALRGNARFLADDHAIINAEGRAFLHLLPIHIYGYHLQQMPALRERALRPYSRLNRALWHVAGHVRGPGKTVRWISPEALLGRERLAREARLEQVVTMFRASRGNFEWRECSAAEAARPCVNVILEEVGGFCKWLALGGAGPFPGPMGELSTAVSRLQYVYERAFSQAHCAAMTVPIRASPADVRAFMLSREPGVEKYLARR